MSERNDGGAAFPSLELYESYNRDRQDYEVKSEVATGMTLRDYFAAKAMPVLIERLFVDIENWSGVAEVAKVAYVYADAMLKERGK